MSTASSRKALVALRRLVKELGSAKDVASLLDVATSSVSRWLAGATIERPKALEHWLAVGELVDLSSVEDGPELRPEVEAEIRHRLEAEIEAAARVAAWKAPAAPAPGGTVPLPVPVAPAAPAPPASLPNPQIAPASPPPPAPSPRPAPVPDDEEPHVLAEAPGLRRLRGARGDDDVQVRLADGCVETVTVERAARLIAQRMAMPMEDWSAQETAAVAAAIRERRERNRDQLEGLGVLANTAPGPLEGASWSPFRSATRRK